MKRTIEEKVTKEVEFDVPSAYRDGSKFVLLRPAETPKGYSVDQLTLWKDGFGYIKNGTDYGIPFDNPIPLSLWFEKYEQVKDAINDISIEYMRMLPLQDDTCENIISAI